MNPQDWPVDLKLNWYNLWKTSQTLYRTAMKDTSQALFEIRKGCNIMIKISKQCNVHSVINIM